MRGGLSLRQSRTYWICSAPNFRNRDFTTSAGISSPEMRIAVRLEQTTSSINSTSSSNRIVSIGLFCAKIGYSIFFSSRARYSARWPAARIGFDTLFVSSLFISLVFNCAGFSCTGFSRLGSACFGWAHLGVASSGPCSGGCGCSKTVYSMPRIWPFLSRMRRRII